MLKQRVTTAIVMIVVSAWALFGWNDVFFALFLTVLAGLCAWEWSDLVSIYPRALRYGYVLVLSLTVAFMLYLVNEHVLKTLVLMAVVLWIAMAADMTLRPVVNYPPTDEGRKPTQWWLLLTASFMLVVAVSCLYWLRVTHGPGLVVFIIALVAVADTGAYFSGRKFGKRKLALEISGGKTIEGAIGGLALATLVAAIAVGLIAGDYSQHTLFVMSIVAAAFSIVGDLFISRAKRTRELKDSGVLLPGHGGFLDRFDGLLAAIPWVAFAVLWL